LFIIEQQFRAEKSLLSDSSNNELFIINLATVPAERNSISPPAASRKRWQQFRFFRSRKSLLRLTFVKNGDVENQ
jgi:hypothetical protein